MKMLSIKILLIIVTMTSKSDNTACSVLDDANYKPTIGRTLRCLVIDSDFFFLILNEL